MTPPEDSVWSMGSRTARQVAAETALSRDEVWALMRDGTFVWMPHGGRGTRLISWKSVVEYLDRLHHEHLTAAAERD